ncbi:hypothetical protein ACWCRD_10905 [Streptomyces sp. NPDC002092]
MTWPAALPGAALRVMRTAAGRRALQVVLLVGGLFALGFLCGEQAHAAEQAPAATSSSEVLPTAPADGVRASLTSDAVATATRLTNKSAATVGRLTSTSATPQPQPSASDKPKPTTPAAPAPVPAPAPADPKPAPDPGSLPATPGAAGQVLAPLTGELVRSVGDRVLQPVGGPVEAVTAGLGRVAGQIPPLAPLSSLPGVPGPPSMPGLPELPGFPSSPGHILPAPVAQAPQPGVAGHPGTEGPVDDRRSTAAASGAAHRPRLVVDVTAGDATAVQGSGRRAGAGYTPAHQTPDGDPAGVPANRAAVDNGTPRHGDAHAVALNHRPLVRLVPGAAVRAAAAGTRDRHRDIPVFPG